MENKIIGFVGLDVQDTILYLSRIFYHMGKRVLMADYSESQALYYSIPLIPGTDAYAGLVEYRGTYFTGGPIREKEYGKFDVIMIFFGFAARREMERCTHMIYTTDSEKNHTERLREVSSENAPGENAEYSQLVYRNAGRSVKEGRALSVREVCQYSCNDNSREKKLRMKCQYNEIFSFRGISAKFRHYLEETVRAVFPEEGMGKAFSESFRRAQEGL